MSYALSQRKNPWPMFFGAIALVLALVAFANGQSYETESGESSFYFEDYISVTDGENSWTNDRVMPWKPVLVKFNLGAGVTNDFTLTVVHNERTVQYQDDVVTNILTDAVVTNKFATNVLITAVSSNAVFSTTTTNDTDIVLVPDYSDFYVVPGDYVYISMTETAATKVVIIGKQ